jgi:xylulose-5-phosphate/fructose-6-phosphate phosphoketolase
MVPPRTPSFTASAQTPQVASRRAKPGSGDHSGWHKSGATLSLARPVDLKAIAGYRRAADYLAAAQIYLRDNCLLDEPLRPEHVKEHLLGHWGTCPGISLVHAHLNRLVVERDANVMLVTGPGHGAAALLANQYLDGTLAERFLRYGRDRAGLFEFVQAFAVPEGFPSHVSPLTPGAINEGDVFGHALATAFGAAFDNPGLVVACIVGDGEAETGPTATAWHGTKFLDPATCGAVLPILHVNGYKQSSPTVYGTMGDGELSALFQGLGWDPLFASAPDLDASLAAAFDEAYRRILARGESDFLRPRWPMIVLRSAKGLGGPKRVDGHPVEGSYRAHGTPAGALRTNPTHLSAVEEWLRGYGPQELFDPEGRPTIDLDEVCPAGERRLGMNPHAGASSRRPLDLPDPAGHDSVGGYLEDVLRRSEADRSFRIVSPDELESHGLGRVFAATGRAYTWPVGPDDTRSRPDGRVLETASESICQAWLQGYLQTGRHGLYVGSELRGSLLAEYADWLEASRSVAWRAPVSSFVALLVGDSPAPPEGIDASVHRPADEPELVSTLDACLRSTDEIHLIVGLPSSR